MKYSQCEQCHKMLGTINLCANFGLGMTKLVGAIVTMSKALLADTVHSIADLWISLALYLTLKVSAKAPDSKYPYGRGNIEFICSAFIGVLLMVVAISIIILSLRAIIMGELPDIGVFGIPVEIVCILGNEILARHSFCVADKFHSPAILANARENRADATTSIAALFGVAGTRLGFRFLDPVAAIFVGGFIGKYALSTARDGIQGLLGRSIDREQLEIVNEIAGSVDGVEKIYSLKARRLGPKVMVDLEIGIEPETKLEDGLQIAELLKASILQQADYVGGVSLYFK